MRFAGGFVSFTVSFPLRPKTPTTTRDGLVTVHRVVTNSNNYTHTTKQGSFTPNICVILATLENGPETMSYACHVQPMCSHTQKKLTRRKSNGRARAGYVPPRGRAANFAGVIRRGSEAPAAGAVRAYIVEHSSVEEGLTDACLCRAWCTKRSSSKRYSSRITPVATRWCHTCGGVIVPNQRAFWAVSMPPASV